MKIITFRTDMSIGINENGTGCIRCPVCGQWEVGSRLSWHLGWKHPDIHKDMKSQARNKSKGG